jgi:hypothetical protein
VIVRWWSSGGGGNWFCEVGGLEFLSNRLCGGWERHLIWGEFAQIRWKWWWMWWGRSFFGYGNLRNGRKNGACVRGDEIIAMVLRLGCNVRTFHQHESREACLHRGHRHHHLLHLALEGFDGVFDSAWCCSMRRPTERASHWARWRARSSAYSASVVDAEWTTRQSSLWRSCDADRDWVLVGMVSDLRPRSLESGKVGEFVDGEGGEDATGAVWGP